MRRPDPILRDYLRFLWQMDMASAARWRGHGRLDVAARCLHNAACHRWRMARC